MAASEPLSGRRRFLGAGAACLALAACGRREPPIPPGDMLATAHRIGHRMRDGPLPAPGEERAVRVAIVGAGIGGLTAAWRLHRAGFADVEILELEDAPGGNARWGENSVSAFPWGAHYIPLPTRESRSTRLLLADLGVLHGDPDAATPRYDERALVHAPQERLYRHGAWSEGLAALDGRTPAEAAEWRRFLDRIDALRTLRGRDGRPAFAIPLDFSSRDPELLALDRMTFDAWLRSQGFQSELVAWLARYACRDDYGCDYRQVSAWAGIHYFACRTGEGLHAEPESVLTWPEGNGFIVRRLLERLQPRLTAGALVHRVEEEARGVVLDAFLAREERCVRIRAEHVVWASPFGFAARAFADRALAGAMGAWHYAPWLTANITVSEPPYVHHGAPLAWDNVIYDSVALGYVVATHQGLASRPGPTVLTWYLPLCEPPPAEGRRLLLATPREAWARLALADLAAPHPEIHKIARRVDVFANGHAMVRPVPGLLWGEARGRILAHRGRIHFAHADASGLSLFEEATDRGVAAAEAVLAALGERSGSFRFNAA